MIYIVRNSSESKFTLVKNEKVEQYIKMKTYKLIVLKFFVEIGVKVLYSWTHVSSILYLPVKLPLQT